MSKMQGCSYQKNGKPVKNKLLESKIKIFSNWQSRWIRFEYFPLKKSWWILFLYLEKSRKKTKTKTKVGTKENKQGWNLLKCELPIQNFSKFKDEKLPVQDKHEN